MHGTTQAGQNTVADLGEIALVERIIAVCSATPAQGIATGAEVVVGPGDDAAVIRMGNAAGEGHDLVISTDMAVEGRHFRLDWSEPGDIGHRVAAANLADIAAMGARPTTLVVALALPGSTTVTWVEEMMAGIVAEAESVGARVVGGDVSSADTVVISITALGEPLGDHPLVRSGAQVADVIAVAGRLGWAAAGLAVLTRGFRSPRALVDAYRRPEPPYAAAAAAVASGAHALMDVSDGLLIDAQRLARASGVGINLDSAALEIAEPVASAAAAYNLDPLQWILGGGDDHALLGAFDPATGVPEGFTVIGSVIEVDEPAAGTVLVDGRLPEVPAGFEHFRR